MRILFAGTPEIAVPSLEALADADGITVAGVLTAPDRVSGRGRRMTAPPVKTAAEALGIPVLQPERLGPEARDAVGILEVDLLVVFAYGKIFGPRFLDCFPLGGINMHPSALPKYRGPAPISAAIMGGETETALTVQKISLEMDAGDILIQRLYPLTGRETTGSLTDSVARDAAPILVEGVRRYASGEPAGRPQADEDATWCRLVTRDDGDIDWSESAERIERRIRACIPWPKARTSLRGESLVLLESSVVGGTGDPGVPGRVTGVDKSRGILIQTGEGLLGVTRLQLASRKPLDFKAFLNGVTVEEGTLLGDDNES